MHRITCSRAHGAGAHGAGANAAHMQQREIRTSAQPALHSCRAPSAGCGRAHLASRSRSVCRATCRAARRIQRFDSSPARRHADAPDLLTPPRPRRGGREGITRGAGVHKVEEELFLRSRRDSQQLHIRMPSSGAELHGRRPTDTAMKYRRRCAGCCASAVHMALHSPIFHAEHIHEASGMCTANGKARRLGPRDVHLL
jgi:hypothetical protein